MMCAPSDHPRYDDLRRRWEAMVKDGFFISWESFVDVYLGDDIPFAYSDQSRVCSGKNGLIEEVDYSSLGSW